MKKGVKKKGAALRVAPFLVGVTGLEPATAWSQTRNATNCATPRIHLFSKCGAKVVHFFQSAKQLQKKKCPKMILGTFS